MTNVSPAPLFSLVMSTKGRTEELARFLQSLDRQTERSFELIVSDQNTDGRLHPVLEPYLDRFPIRHIRSFGGISRGRNAALPLASGRYVAFPDDDCWYPPALLGTVRRQFELHPEWDVVTGRSVDEAMCSTQGRWPNQTTTAGRSNIARLAISYTIFARAELVSAVGLFDEQIGVGAGTPWESGEETDFLLRALACRRTVVYTPDIAVYHLEKARDYSRLLRTRQFCYARGLGRVLRKNGISLLEAFPLFARPLAGCAAYLVRGQTDRSLTYLQVFAGRAIGWLGISRPVVEGRALSRMEA